MNILSSGLVSIVIGTLFATPALILGYWLKKNGTAPNRSWESLLFCIILALVNQFWLPTLSYGWLALISIVGSTLGVYRMDIYWASKRSRSDKSES